jgi:peroxiredoxin
MPAFNLPNAVGGSVDSKNLTKSSVIVVVFTCNHCPYAKAVEGRLIDLQNQFVKDNVAFVLVSSNDAEKYPDDSPEAMKELATKKHYPFPYCYDESQEVAKSFGALCTPHCFVFDGEKKLQYMGRVDDNWKEPSKVQKRELHDAILALVQGKKPVVTKANALGCSIKWKEVGI